MSELYNEKINEFVDWVDGTNCLTHNIETLNAEGLALPVSGEQIRKLILDRLIHPIYANEGNDNMIRLFSSEESYNIWNNAGEDDDFKDDLVLFEFALPSQYKIKTSGLLNGEVRHIIAGDKDAQSAKIMFTWAVTLGDEYTDDTVAVTYKVENSLYAAPKSRSVIYTNRNETVVYDMSEYLDLGENTVTVTIKGLNTGASSSFSFTMVIVSLNITSTFRFFNSVSDIINIPYRLERNDYSENVIVKVYIDGNLVKSDTKYKGDTNPNGTITIDNSKDLSGNRPYESSIISLNDSEKNRFHNLQIQAETVYNGTPFKSNLLYYDFVVPSDNPVANAIITTAVDFTSAQASVSPFQELIILGQLFQRINLRWAYYTDLILKNTSVSVSWKIQKGEDGQNEQIIPLSVIDGNKGLLSSDLSFEPTVYTEENNPVYLDAYIANTRIRRIPMYIQLSEITVSETLGYAIKLSASGKTNQSTDKKTWLPEGQQANITFSNAIRWDDFLGWYNNSFRVSGTDCYATIDYNPFFYNSSDDSTKPQAEGRTIELDFEVEKTVSEDDTVILIGGETGARIEIKPSKAILYDTEGTARILTNYKDNERVKIVFIINGSTTTSIDRNLVYIVTNGILERAAKVQGYNFERSSGNIKIGGSRSGIKFYSLRVYRGPISYMGAYNNYVFDSENKAYISSKNDIFDNTGNISYDKCRNKIDTILISGNLTNILSASSDKDKSETDVTISRHCPTDTTKDFICEGCRIRKHGQSTLFYPITSMKIWLNKSVSGNTPRLSCPDQESLLLAKNRYKMKDTSVPANKFVLQANYADSSGVHNGGLLRLILNSWYNARINDKFLLRTEPQLFASINTSDKSQYGLTNVWKDYSSGKDFPYELEIGADSFPCVVFYENTADDGKITYLGQYVFMEDKKSDFNYGERSIYKADAKDPFCLTTYNKKGDTNENKVWDNSNVLRIEVVNVNTPFSSYMSDHIYEHGENRDFMQIIEPQLQEDPNEDVPEILRERHYRWEEDFELIYPDPEDIEGRQIGPYVDDKGNSGYLEVDTSKFADPTTSKFCKTTKPFIDWFRWLVSTYNNHELFRLTAEEHLDLYKLAAYYVFFMRFGLVDSVERNVQLKTYDGQHWHYEPWDMDIALGNRNTGGIAFDPPIDRDTRNPGDDTSWALSGRSSTTSNWLWDALENWPYWNAIVRTVADALHQAGLTYDKCIEMFDDNYANKWSETIYNESGYFKYIESGNGSELWLAWLQGARMPHRHWWLSTSMDYYDAKWKVGDYVNHYIHIRGTHAINDPAIVLITASKQTYFSLENDTSTLSTVSVAAEETANFNMTSYAITDRNNIRFYGAKNMESFKLGGLADGLSTINISGAYSDVLGACLKTFDISTTLTKSSDTEYTGSVNPRAQEVNIAYSDDNKNALQVLQTLNIRGLLSISSITSKMFNDLDELMDLSSIVNIYALGSGLLLFSSSYRGNSFDTIELPTTVRSIYMRNSSWNTIEFWNTGTVNSTIIGLVDDNGDPVINPTTNLQDTVLKNTATITKVNSVPSTITSMSLLGSTGHYKCSKDIVLNWILSIIDTNGTEALSNYSLTMDDIYWDSENCNGNLLTYNELALIAKLNGLADETDPEIKAAKRQRLKGYILLSRENGDLSVLQLSLIRSWFGDAVFTLSARGSGLVIDYAYEYSLISVGEPAYYDNGEFYIKEGKSAALNITSFNLKESPSNNPWFINIYNNGVILDIPLTAYNKISVVQDAEGVYRVNVEEGNETPYRVYIYTTDEGRKVGITLNTVPVTYPQSYRFDVLYYQGTEDRSSDGVLNMYSVGNLFELYLKPNEQYDATITDVIYTISTDEGTVSDNINKSYKVLPQEYTLVDDILLYSKHTSLDPDNIYGLRINAYGDLPNEPKYYTVTALIKFKNSVMNTTESIRIVVLNDNIPILSSVAGDALYSAVANAYSTLFGGTAPLNFYKIHLSKLTVLNFNSYSTIHSLITLTGESLLKYLTSVLELRFDDCTNLLMTYSGVNQFDLSNNLDLRKLYLNGCTYLSGTIDLSNNVQLREVDTSGNVPVNVILPNDSQLSKLRLGKPTIVEVNGAMNLNTFSVSYVSQITSLTLVKTGSGNSGSFNRFMNLSGLNISNLTNLVIDSTGTTENLTCPNSVKLRNIIETTELNSGITVRLSGSLNCTPILRSDLTYLQEKASSNDQRYNGLTISSTNIYDELEYISSDSNNQYIKYTNAHLLANGNRDFDFDIKFRVTSDVTSLVVIGCVDWNAGRNYYGYCIGTRNTTPVDVRSASNSNISASSNQTSFIYGINEDVVINTIKNDTAYNIFRNSTYNYSSDVNLSELTILCANTGANKYILSALARIYYYKIYKNNSLIIDAIPVRSTLNEVGMYNKVDGTLATSSRNRFVEGPYLAVQEPELEP